MAIELAEATEIHKNAMKQKTLMVDETSMAVVERKQRCREYKRFDPGID